MGEFSFEPTKIQNFRRFAAVSMSSQKFWACRIAFSGGVFIMHVFFQQRNFFCKILATEFWNWLQKIQFCSQMARRHWLPKTLDLGSRMYPRTTQNYRKSPPDLISAFLLDIPLELAMHLGKMAPSRCPKWVQTYHLQKPFTSWSAASNGPKTTLFSSKIGLWVQCFCAIAFSNVVCG